MKGKGKWRKQDEATMGGKESAKEGGGSSKGKRGQGDGRTVDRRRV